MERKIGEIFNYQDNWYQCIENTGYGCIICHFNTHNNICCNNVLNIIGNCLPPYRKDYKSVVFRKLEKVGNPIMVENKSYQKIKVPDSLCNNCVFYDNFSRNCKLSYYINHQPAYSCLKDEIFVEIKQNKENMEEREYSEEDMKNNPRFKHHKNIEQVINMQKMKPFDLEAAKAGKPVCTRDGRKARIMSFDRKSLLGGKKYLIVALVEDDTKEEIMYSYNEKGKVLVESDIIHEEDLMMLPEKKEGWINIYKDNDMVVYCIYKTKEEAIKNKSIGDGYITTIKIDWEE